jgi:flagellar biosynthetic protein FlhB
MAGDKDQRTEKQTARRKKESRQKGQVARSQTLVGWVALLVATSLLPRLLAVMGERLAGALAEVESIAAEPTTGELARIGFSTAWQAMLAVVPLLVVVVLVGVAGSFAQTGFVFTLHPLAPKLERLSPAKGFKRLVSPRNIWETARQVVLLGIILLLAVPSVVTTSEELASSSWSLTAMLASTGKAVLSLIQIIAVIGTAAGLVDYGWQRWNLVREGRMTKQEVRQEHRETDGDPMVKAKLRSLRAAMSRNRMLAAVADADVVITNPTHVAVALQYVPARGAPRVLAAGGGSSAARIRERAAGARVPVVGAPPLARALHRCCRPGDEIPRELFQAVATVLAFVHTVGRSTFPQVPVSLPVIDTWTPPGCDPEAVTLSDARAAARRRRRRRPARSLSTRTPVPMEQQISARRGRPRQTVGRDALTPR